MGKTLGGGEKILYAGGDEKYGQELILVKQVTTTHKSDAEPKPIECPKYKTLGQAVKELANIEKAKGTEKFCKDVIDRKELLKGHLAITHNEIIGGGNPNDPEIEDTEFTNVRVPYFVDIEYVEVGYALAKQGISPGATYTAWISFKWTYELFKLHWTPPFANFEKRQNRIGLQIGWIISKEYKNLMDFADQLIAAECDENLNNKATETLGKMF